MTSLERKIATLVRNPDRVVKKYARKLWYRLLYLGRIRPLGCENYDTHWKYLSFKQKTILDLGADYGSTTDYFLRNGARKVVAVEGDIEYASKLFLNFGGDQRVPCIRKWITSGKDISQLIALFQPDIVKVDIEGKERLLLDVDVGKVKEWLIETHTERLYQMVRKFFTRNGFKVSMVEYGKTLYAPQVKVLIAKI